MKNSNVYTFAKGSLLLFCVFLSFIQSSKAQTVLITQDFNSYVGTSLSVPTGWTFSWNSGSSTAGSYYTSTQFSGISGPNSYKFGQNNVAVTTPAFSNADSASFWIKGSATDALSYLVVLEQNSSMVWVSMDTIRPLPTVGTIKKYPVNVNSVAMQVKYSKSQGNVAFDDFKLTQNVVSPVADFGFTNVCAGQNVTFTDMTTIVGGNGTISSWAWDFGDTENGNTQNPTHTYAAGGTFQVALTVTLSNGNFNTVTKNVIVENNPVAGFNSNQTTQSLNVTFANQSTITAPGTITTYTWNFADAASGGNNISALQNPQHNFSVAGTYNVCLTVTTGNGCLDEICKDVVVVPVGIANANKSNPAVLFPNPTANGLVTIDFGKPITEKVRIVVMNILGNVVEQKELREMNSGKVVVDLSNQSEGNYFFTITSGKETITKRVVYSR